MSTQLKKPMSGGYIAVYIFCLFMCFLSIFGRGIGVLLWGYVIWQMHKRNNQLLASFFKGLIWFDLIAGGIGFIALLSLGGGDSTIGIGMGAFLLLIGLGASIAFALMIFFKNQCDVQNVRSNDFNNNSTKDSGSFAESQPAYKTYPHTEGGGVSRSPKFIADDESMDIKGDDAWDLAIKYDPGLLTTFKTIHQIDASYAEQFKHTVMELNSYTNYRDIAKEIMNKAIGAEGNKSRYSDNDLINEIIIVLLQKNGKAAKEFMELVKLYSLESPINDQTIDRTLSMVKKIEDLYGILVLKEVKSLKISSNDFEIKFGLYEKSNHRGVTIFRLKNGNGVIERSSQYRVYDSVESAQAAADLFASQELWTNKNIVETIDRNS
jgi:hypothetical protein